ncbi:RHS repeat-associated core domain-containing protein, partial [Streptococcus azizii]
YDDFGNISQLTYPDGSSVSYTYDDLDRLTSVTDKDGKKTTYRYNEAGDMTQVTRGDGTKSFLTYDRGHRVTEMVHRDQKDKLIASYAYEYDDGDYITKETITQDGETLIQAYTYDSLGQVISMVVTDKEGKELSSLTYSYDLAGNKLTSTETIEGKEETTRFTYDDHNRLIKLENKDGTTSYTYDKNGNRISSQKNDEKLDYIYDTENRLLAVKDKAGLLFAALYDGDDNRVFTASRKEGKHSYRLFKREEKKKSPHTAPNGEAHSLFWYGFSQNVLQSLSSLPQTIGTIWHAMFDDVSTAYHKKVAKDRANDEGLVVNPPDLGNLPGEGEVTYASEVKEVLIPYTTREDSFHYYEERNYVNDVNRKHTEVLQTYDRELKARETYTYGQGRSSYHNHGTGDTYQYLTNQAGSVTGLTKDGQAVASSKYQLYGSTKDSTDETGNPYAYNGEARDSTGLDYLRARYYDSQAGTFLTEDSYQGELDDPLSQNRYAYVQNNPVNYTDPSGHFPSPFTMMVGGGGRPLYQQPKPLINPKDGTLYAPTTPEHEAHQIRQQQTGVYSYTYIPSHVPTSSAYEYIQQQESQLRAQAHAQAVQYRQQQIQQEYAQSIGQYGRPRAREANNLLLNWSKALKDMFTHVCDPKTTKAKDKGRSPKPISFGGGGVASWEGTAGPSSRYQPNASDGTRRDNRTNEQILADHQWKWNATVNALKILGWELSGLYNAKRLWTGKDPVTGEKANRWWAAGELAFDVASYAVA